MEKEEADLSNFGKHCFYQYCEAKTRRSVLRHCAPVGRFLFLKGIWIRTSETASFVQGSFEKISFR